MKFRPSTPHTLFRLAVLAFTACVGINPAKAQPPAASLTHPIRLPNAASKDQSPASPLYRRAAAGPVGLAGKGAKWSFYSRGVNEINAVSTSGSETWLATNCGVKVLDKVLKTMRHYTQFDGMPGMKTLTISADADEAFCIQNVAKNNLNFAEFCALNRKTGVWKTLKETIFPDGFLTLSKVSDQRPSPGGPIANAITVATPERACFAVSPVPRDSKTIAYVYDRRLKLWDELPDNPAFHKDIPSLSLNWADADRDGIWFGTNAGLLKWSFREKKWDAWLKNRMIYAGMKAEDGTLWLSAYEPPSVKPEGAIIADVPQMPANGFGQPGSASSGAWALVKFDRKTSVSKAYPIAFPNPNQNAYSNYPLPIVSGMSMNQGTVWLTSANATPYELNVSFAFFLPKEEKFGFSRPLNPQQLALIPEGALLQPSLPRGRLLASLVPARFQSWFCTENVETNAIVDLDNRYKDPGKDMDKTRWLGQGPDLWQTDESGTMLRSLRPSGVSFPTHLPVSCIGVLGDLVFIQSNQLVYAYDLKKERWSQVPVPRINWSNPPDQKILASGDSMLIGNSWQTLRYFPKSEQFKLESAAENSYNRLVGEDAAGGIWLIGQDALLRRADPITRNLEVFHPPVPSISKDAKPIYSELRPLAFSNGIIWLYKRHNTLDKSVIVGYDPILKQWTPELNLNYGNVMQPNAFEAVGKAYLAMQDGKGTIYSYDVLKKEWVDDLPPPPNKFTGNGFSLASVGDQEAWAFSSSAFSLLRFDREKKSWESFPMPANVWSPTGNNLARRGNDFFLASGLGVWSFDTLQRTWKHLPGAPLQSVNLQVRAVGEKAVWMTGDPNLGGQAFVVRYDKKTSNWTRWTEDEGLPNTNTWQLIAPDEESCWAMADYGKLFHYLPKTNRWENVSALLGGDRGPIQFSRVVPDGKQVWLETVANQNGLKESNPFPSAVIVRYDTETGKFSPFTPDAGHKYYSHRMEIDKDSAWVSTSDGVFRLDKKSLAWKEILIPQALSGVKNYEIMHIERRDKELWLVGKDDAIRMEAE